MDIIARWDREIEHALRDIEEIEQKNKDNLYEEIFKYVKNMDAIHLPKLRQKLVRKYAWAIPNNRALKSISKYTPIIEIGAGTGYWANQLSKLGTEILCFDKEPREKSYYPVQKGNWNQIEKYPNHNLFLCWPPYNDPLALECLRAFKGKYFIYVGEEDGCTGDDDFRELLARSFNEIKNIGIPRWWGLHDRLYIYERKTGG